MERPVVKRRDASNVAVAITHDFLETYGGAERVTQEMAQAFPGATVTSILGRPSIAERMGIAERWRPLLPPRPRLLERYRLLAPALPALTDTIRLPEADVVLSSSYAYAHRLRTRNGAPHVCYCHSPLRFAWSMTGSYRDRWASNTVARAAFDALTAGMRWSDRRSSQRVHSYLTQSPFTADQIRRFYGRAAQVIGAPVDCDLFAPSGRDPDDYFLLCGRLIEPYKRPGITVEAFRRLPHRLVVAGDGPALAQLRRVASPNVHFTGALDDRDLVPLMQGCRAAIFPSRDDFGLIPVEVMACGRPVLAFNGGGAPHTVKAGVTGELFGEQTPDAVEQEVKTFDPQRYDSGAIRAHAEQWDRLRFRARLVDAVLEAVG